MSVSEKEVLNPVETAMRSFCSNRSAPMFKPELGMTFSSAAEAYQFYNLYSWVLGFSIRNGDAYQKKDGQRTMQEFNCQRQVNSLFIDNLVLFSDYLIFVDQSNGILHFSGDNKERKEIYNKRWRKINL